MSLPAPTNTGRLVLDPKELEQLEAPLLALAQMSGGDLRKLLFAFFNFLNRRTDFYVIPNQEESKANLPAKMGFQEGDAEKLLLAAFRQFPLRRAPPQRTASSSTAMGSPASVQSPKKDTAQPPATKEGAKKEESEKKEEDQVKAEKSSPTATVEKKKSDTDDFTVRYTDEDKQIPIGNGGSTDKYKWTQTLEETSVLISVPKGTKGKDLNVSLKASSISIRMNKKQDGEDSPRILVDGTLVGKIRTDESTWSLEGGVVVVTLDKLQKTWWETVIVDDEKIDTSLVDSTRKINTYDESTQAMIRKIIFDQNQERRGLPTSEKIMEEQQEIPKLPPGVEYIGKETMDKI